MASEEEILARMGLCALGHLASPKLAILVREEGPEWVWDQLSKGKEDQPWSRKAAAITPKQIWEETQRCGAAFLTPDDELWPSQLKDLDNSLVGGQGGAPFGLWVRGEIPSYWNAVSIVGARAASQYGIASATELSAELSSVGVQIISGLAFGIDAAAHRGALGVGGTTIAVVASGVDRPYPSANAALAEILVRNGAIISEAPPGAHPTRPSFLARNRIIAALGRATIVVEAALRSGAKNTAAWASELGRLVLALPGQVTSTLSATPHRLIRSGQAILITDARDVLTELAPLGSFEEPSGRGKDCPFDGLPDEAKTVREAIEVGEEVSANILTRRTGLPLVSCLAALQFLAEGGWLERGPEDGWRLPTRR